MNPTAAISTFTMITAVITVVRQYVKIKGIQDGGLRAKDSFLVPPCG